MQVTVHADEAPPRAQIDIESGIGSWVDDGTILRTNGVHNPSPQDATQLIAGFTAQGGTGGVISRVATAGVNGGFAARYTATIDTPQNISGPQVGGSTTAGIEVVAGQPFTPSLSVSANTTRSARILWLYYDATNAQVGATRTGSVTVALVANAPMVRIQEPTETVPAGATHAMIRAYDPANGWSGARTNLFPIPQANASWVISGTASGNGGAYTPSNESTLSPFPAALWKKGVVTAAATAGYVEIAPSTAVAPVTIGQTVALSMYGYSSVAADTAITYYYKDASGTILNAGFTSTATNPAGAAQRRSVVMTVPNIAGIVSVSATIRFVTATQLTVGAVFGGSASMVEVVAAGTVAAPPYVDGALGANLLTNAAPTSTSGFGSRGSGAFAYDAGASALRVTAAAAVGGTGVSYGSAISANMVAGQSYVAAVDVTAVDAGTYALQAVGLLTPGAQLGAVALAAGETRRLWATGVASAAGVPTLYLLRSNSLPTASQFLAARFSFVVSSGYLTDDIEFVSPHPASWSGAANATTSARGGDTMTIDRVSTAAGDYVDGATPAVTGALPFGKGTVGAWAGTPYASVSYEKETSFVSNPAVTFTTLDLYRDGVLTRKQPFTGQVAAVVDDYEMNRQVDVTYRLVYAYSTAPTALLSETVVVRLDIDEAWIIHPLLPQVSVALSRIDDSKSGLSKIGDGKRATTRTLHYVIGQAEAVHTSTGQRRAVSRSIEVETVSDSDQSTMIALFADDQVVLFLIPPSWKLLFENGWYSVDDLDELLPAEVADYSYRTWTLPVQKSVAPITVVQSLWSRQALMDSGFTREQIASVWATRLDLMQNRRVD